MKHLSTTFALLSVLRFTVQARTLHVDVSQDGHVEVEVDMDGVRESPNVMKDKSHISEDQVDLYYEIHQGFETKSGKYMNFSNIPYAEPPVGELRWAPTEYVYKDKEEVNNGSRRAVCPQFQVGWIPPATDFVHDMLLDPVLDKKWNDPIGPDDYASYKPKPELHPDSSEDCLTLDVLVPKKVWKERNSRSVYGAVLVWIHGGGFVYGSKDVFGSPEQLLDRATQESKGDSIIFVSINYRLGAFGWLGGDALMDEGGYPNAGLMDQKFALKWVRDNIHLFGGDSKRITVMGESAGASSILHHITSNYQERPVFKSAIIQSPGFFPAPDQSVHDKTYQEFLRSTNSKDFEELLKADTKVLMQANADMTYKSNYGLFKFGPTVDGYQVPDLPSKRLQDTNSHHKGINVMIGHTKFDGLVFTPPWIRTDAQLREHVLTLYPGIPEAVLKEIEKRYPVKDFGLAKEKILQVSDFLDDIAIQCNTHYLSEAMLNHPPSYSLPQFVYRYVFNIVPAIHGADVPYTFYPSIETKPAPNPDVAQFWQSAIANFTMFLTPNDEDSEFWPLYNPDNRTVMNFGNAGQWLVPNYDVGTGKDVLDREKCAYWQDAPYYVPPKRKMAGSYRKSRGKGQQERMEM